MKRPVLESSQGVISLEFVFTLLIFSALTFGIVEFGSILHERNVITHLSREGASIYSRDLDTAPNIINLIQQASQPLDFPNNQNRYRVFVARAAAGNPPVCAASVPSAGNLSGASVVDPALQTNCGLTPALWAYLQQNALGVSQMQQFSVVRVYYQHNALTPLAGLLSLDFFGGGGLSTDPILSSTAIF